MEGDLVLITGATGHVGFRVLQYALEYGFRVRAAVRSQAKADAVCSNPAVRVLNKDDRLTTVIVPDFTVSHAFEKAVENVKYIIHCASPIPFGPLTTDNAHEDFIKPAVDATLAIFLSAAKEKSIARIVVTSSCIAVAPVAAAISDTGETYTADTRQPEPDSFGPGTMSFVAYAGGKVSALNQTEEWIKENDPHFDVIHLMPSYVLGRNELYSSVDDMMASSNSLPLNVVRAIGESEGGPAGMGMVTNHIDDCARIHIEALDPKIEGGQSFMISYDWQSLPQWDDAKAIVEKHFPEAVKAGILPNKGSLPSICCRLESAKTEKVFGFRHSYEDAVVSCVGQYLELREKEQMQNEGPKN